MLSQMSISAQQDNEEMTAKKTERNQAEKMERIQAQKIAFISTELNLTVEEAQQFWPIYNEYTNQRRELKKDKKINHDNSELSENDADKLLDQIISNKEKDLAIQKEYLSKFKEVIPSKKVVQLIRLEHRYKNEIIQNIEKRLKHRRNHND